jgi:uncharacterized protein YjdB
VDQTATITATFLGLSASQTVVVRPGSLEVSPTSRTIAKGTAQQMFATAIFGQDGVTDSTGTNLAADFGSAVAWSSDNTAVATVDDNGVARGVGAGTANITAKTGVTCPVAADLTTPVIVQDTALSDFDFVPTSQFSLADIGLATSSFVRLIGNFANGLVQDLTGQAELTSDDATVVSELSNLVTGKGAASATDSTNLTASFDQDGSGSGAAVTEQQPVTVDDVKRLSAGGLNISPAGPLSMLQGTTRDLDVLGSFDDGSTQSLYRNVFWSTSDSTIAAANVAGIVTASASKTGTATLTATRTDPLSSTEFAPTVSISVVDTLAVVSLDVTCQDPIYLAEPVGDCRAVVTFNDSSTQDVSLAAVWGSSSPAIAEVSNARLIGARRNEVGDNTPLPGRVYALAEGSTTIRASLFDGSGNRLATDTDSVTVSSAMPPPPDSDADGVTDASDNCPLAANAGQENNDGDAEGDVCDADDDNDGDLDGADNCPLAANADQLNTDGDASGDACDTDDDNDGVLDGTDQCPLVAQGSNPSNSRTGCPCNNPNPLPIPPACLE